MRALRISNLAPACAALAWLAAAGPVVASETCSVEPLECLQPAPLSQIEGARFAWGTTSGADAWVARFDGDAEAPTWRIPIAGSGVDTVSTVTLTKSATELLVAGSTTSPSLEGVDAKGFGNRDGFVLRLDAATGRILSGLFVGGPEDEDLTGVTVDPEGRILVSGIGALENLGEAPAALTVVEPDNADGPGKPVFVAVLDGKLGGEKSRFNLGTIQAKEPRVWTDCKGSPVAGIVPLGFGDCNGTWPDVVYEQSQINQDFLTDQTVSGPGNPGTFGTLTPPGGWGFHALRWKEYHANANRPAGSPPYALDWSLRPTSPDIPKHERPDCYHADALNTLETDLYLKGGVATDPPGLWGCNDHTSMPQLALISSFLFTRFGTPVYTHVGYFNSLQQPIRWDTYPVAIERVVYRPFCPSNANAYHGETLRDMCNFADPSIWRVDQLNCTVSTGTPGVYGNNFLLRVERFEGAYWAKPGGASWARPVIWPGDIFSQSENWYEPGKYVLDPPEGSEETVALLEAASRQSTSLIVRSGTARVTRLEGGISKCAQTMDTVLAASE